mgnify:CR=1 FL=1
MDDFYMLQQMDLWITGNYGEDFFEGQPEEDESEEDQ